MLLKNKMGTQTTNKTPEEKFKEKYQQVLLEIPWLRIRDDDSSFEKDYKRNKKNAYSKDGQEFYGILCDIISPIEIEGSSATLFHAEDTSKRNPHESNTCPEYVLKAAGANFKKLMPDYERENCRYRDKDLLNQRFEAINNSDYVIGSLEYICDEAFYPILRDASKQGKETIIFMNMGNLFGMCSEDWELQELKKLKEEGNKKIHIVTRSGHNLHLIKYL